MGVDIRDLWRDDGESNHWIVLRGTNLPPGARVYQALDLPQAWTVQEHLLADQYDALQQLTWVQVAKGVERSKQPKMPERVPRPGDARAKRERAQDNSSQVAKFREFMAAINSGEVSWPSVEVSKQDLPT